MTNESVTLTYKLISLRRTVPINLLSMVDKFEMLRFFAGASNVPGKMVIGALPGARENSILTLVTTS